MSKHPTEERSCVGKQRFASRQEARQVLSRWRGTPGVEAYRCRYCDSWHLGHKPARRPCVNPEV